MPIMNTSYTGELVSASEALYGIAFIEQFDQIKVGPAFIDTRVCMNLMYPPEGVPGYDAELDHWSIMTVFLYQAKKAEAVLLKCCPGTHTADLQVQLTYDGQVNGRMELTLRGEAQPSKGS